MAPAQGRRCEDRFGLTCSGIHSRRVIPRPPDYNSAMFKWLLRRRFRRNYLDPALVDHIAATQWKAIRELLRPRCRTFVTQEMVQRIVDGAGERPRDDTNPTTTKSHHPSAG